MRRYEQVFIADPDISEEERGSLFERLKGIVTGNGGFILRFDEWGARKLAYPLKKKARGYYVLFEFCSPPTAVEETERVMRIDERVLKYLTVLVDPSPDSEALRQEAAQVEAKETTPAPAREAADVQTEEPPQERPGFEKAVLTEAETEEGSETAGEEE